MSENMSRDDGHSPHRIEKPGFQTNPDHTAKVLTASILDSLIMQSQSQTGKSCYVKTEEYVYMSPHAYIRRKAAARPKRSKKQMAKIKHTCGMCQESAGNRDKSNVYEDQNRNTNMGQGERHLLTDRDQNDSHLESIYYDASSADKSSEIIEAANTLSKWAIETSQKELRAALENHIKEISKGTKDRLEQEVTRTRKVRGILKKRSKYADQRGRQSEDFDVDVDSYRAESRRLVQLVIDTVLKDMEAEFRDKQLDELERKISDYESVVAAKALWLSEEVMEKAVSEIQKELTSLEDKISRRDQSSPVDETLLSREIGDIVNRSISNAIQDRDSKKVNLVFSDFEEQDCGIGSPSSDKVDGSASCLAKQAICESVEDITDDIRNIAHNESHTFEYSAKMDHDGGTSTSKHHYNPNVNAESVDTGLGVSTNQTEVHSGGVRPMYSSSKYIPLQRPDGNLPGATASEEGDKVVSRKYITLAGNHKKLFTKKYPPIIRPLESLETITSVDESQDNVTTSPSRDTNLKSRKSSASRNTSNKTLNEYGPVGRSAELMDTTCNHTVDENAPPPLLRRNSVGVSRNNNTYTEDSNRGVSEQNMPVGNTVTTTQFVEQPDENVSSLSPRRNLTVTSKRNRTHTEVSNGVMNDYQMSGVPVERVDTISNIVDTEENLPPPPPPPPPPPMDSSNAVVNEYEHTERPVESRYIWKPQQNVSSPPKRNITVISGIHTTGSSSRIMHADEQMEMPPDNIQPTIYAMESFDNLPPPPPPLTEDDTFVNSNMVDQYPQVERNNWESGQNASPVHSVVSRKESPIFRRSVNGRGQVYGPAEDTDTTGYAGDTEESVGRFGESQNVSFDEASDDEAGPVTRFRGKVNQTGVLQAAVPKYSDPACQMVSTKQRVIMRRNHRRIIKKYNTEWIPSDEDLSDYEDKTGQSLPYYTNGEHIPRNAIMSTNNRGKIGNEPECSQDERTYMGDRVYGYQESQLTGVASYSPQVESMGSSQHISFAKRRESIFRQYKPMSMPMERTRCANYMYESPEVQAITYSPGIQGGILINNQDMIETEYEPDYNITKDTESRYNVGGEVNSCEEWQRPTNRYTDEKMYQLEEPRTQLSREASCYSETQKTPIRTVTSDRRMMFKNDSQCPAVNNRLAETEPTSFSPNRDRYESSRRNQQNQRYADECIETAYPVEEYIEHFEEQHKPRGRYVDEGIKMFEQSRNMKISRKSSCQFGRVQKPLPIEGRRVKSRDDISVMEPSGYVNENIYHFENVQHHPQCASPRTMNTQVKYSSPNRDTCMAPRKMQQFQNKTEECTETVYPVEEYIEYFEEPDRPKGRYVDEGIQLFEQSQRTQISPKTSYHSGEVKRPCVLAAEDRTKSRDDVSVVEPSGYVNENIHHFEHLQHHPACAEPRSMNTQVKYSSPNRNTCMAPRKMQQYQNSTEECTETVYPVEEYIEYFEEPHRPKGRYVDEGIQMFEQSRRLQISPKSSCHFGRVQKPCELPIRDTNHVSRDDDSVAEPMCSLEENIDHFENLQRQTSRSFSTGRKARSVEAIPSWSSPARDPCVNSRRKQQFQDTAEECTDTGYHVVENRYPSPCIKARSVERRSRCFPPTRKSDECLQQRALVCHSPIRSNEVRSVCSSPNRSTCMTPREADQCAQTCIPVRENIQYFEQSPRPIRKHVGEGIRNFENMQRTKVCPRSVSHFEGFQKSSRLPAADCCVDENIHCFDRLQTQALGCPSSCVYPKFKETGQKCYPPSSNTRMRTRESEECNETSIPVGENIRHFEILQKQAIGCTRPRYKETGQRCLSPSRNTCVITRKPAECSYQQTSCCSSPCRSNEARSRCSSPNRNTCMSPTESDQCIETCIPVRENIQYFEQSPRPIRKHVGEGIRNYENMQRAKFCPESVGHFEGFQKSTRLAEADRCVDENIHHFEHLQRQALGCPSPCITPRSLETRPRFPRQHEKCTGAIFPVEENSHHFEEDQRPRSKPVIEGIRDFEYMQRIKLSPGSDCYYEGSYKSNGPTMRNQCVVYKDNAERVIPSSCHDDNIHHFEDSRRPSRCVKPKSFETRSKCVASRRDQQHTTGNTECFEPARSVDENVRHFENSQRSRCTPVWEGIQRYEEAQRPQFRHESACHYKNPTHVMSKDDPTTNAPVCTFNENMYNFEGSQHNGFRSRSPRTKPTSPATDTRCPYPDRDSSIIHGSPEECITRRPATESRRPYPDRDTSILTGTPGECMTGRPTTELRRPYPDRDTSILTGTGGECITRRRPTESRCTYPDNDSSIISGTGGECITERPATESRCTYPDRDTSIISGTDGECITRRRPTELRCHYPEKDSSIISGTGGECITGRHATESRCPHPHKGSSIISTAPEQCTDPGFSVGENIRNFEDSQRQRVRYVDDGIRNFENLQNQRISPVRVCHTERTQRSFRSEERGTDNIDSQRIASRSCSPSVENRSYGMDSRCPYPSRGTSMISRRQSPTSRATGECTIQYQPPKSKPVCNGMRHFEENHFQRSEFNPESICHSEGSQRSNRSYVDDSIISRDDAIIVTPPSGVNETVHQFEGSQRSNQSTAKDESIISVENTSVTAPSSRYDSSAEGYTNKTKSSMYDHEKNYPRDDIRSLVYTLMSPYYERVRSQEILEEEERTDQDERRRGSHKYSLSRHQRESRKDRFVMDDDYCRVKCEHAIEELLLMQKLLAESQTGLSQTERKFQEILDAAICERFAAIAKKAVVTTVLDRNLEERIKCGLLVLNVTYALQLNVGDRSMSTEAIARDTKRFVKEILNGIVGREARDMLCMKGDVLNGFKIEMDFGKVQLNGQECSLSED